VDWLCLMIICNGVGSQKWSFVVLDFMIDRDFFFLLSSSLFLLFLRVPSSFCACMFCLSPLFLSFFPLVMARERGIVASLLLSFSSLSDGEGKKNCCFSVCKIPSGCQK